MKTVEIFIDESGDIRRQRPMNITGVAVIAPGIVERDAFHAGYLERLKTAGLTAGVCDVFAPNTGEDAGVIAEKVVMPETFLPKRPSSEDWRTFWGKVQTMAEAAESCARQYGVTLIGFSLQFPSSTLRRWGTPDRVLDQLLDRPYGECLKDVLELLIYETPQIWQTVNNSQGCLLSFDLPTRTLGAAVDNDQVEQSLNNAWRLWGIHARRERNPATGGAEIVAGTLEPSDAIEILTTALNRRRLDGVKVHVERARCCKLVSWSQWQMSNVADDRKRSNRRFWAIESSPRPKQIHFLADLISNGIFNGQIRPNMDPYRIWFDRGFVLSSAEEVADEWLAAVRAFANGDRVLAIQKVGDICRRDEHKGTRTYQFFRRSATGWPEQLSDGDLRRLFAEAV